MPPLTDPSPDLPLFPEPMRPDPIVLPVQTPAGSYPIHIGEGLLVGLGTILADQGLTRGKAAVVSNPDVAALYGELVLDGLALAGFEPTLCLVPEGEGHKTLASISRLYDQFLAAGLDRRSPVLSLGGGVVGDMAGFAAASYLRGVPLVQVPTSLLAMVDASVGGKTGVDLPQGKNLVGAFKQPEAVIIDTQVFRSLPAAEFRSGLAEVVKHGMIGAPGLFEQLERQGPDNLMQLVADAVQVKIRVVEEDPYEQGRRATLNLGHTFGHAIELVSDFQVRHGEGVALGLVAATHMAAALGHCAPSLADRLVHLLDRLELPTRLTGYGVEEVYGAMAHDKKRQGRNLRFIVPRHLGDVIIIDFPGEETVRRALKSILETDG